MRGNGFSVEIETLQAEARTMSSVLDQTKTEIDELMTAMNTLNGSWSGAANLAFRNAFTEDYESAVAGCEALRSTVEKIDEAGRKYRSCEDQVLQRVARL